MSEERIAELSFGSVAAVFEVLANSPNVVAYAGTDKDGPIFTIHASTGPNQSPFRGIKVRLRLAPRNVRIMARDFADILKQLRAAKVDCE